MDKQRQNRANQLREAYREYMECARSLLTLAETTSISESPTREALLRTVFGLQILYNERERLRFEHLSRKGTSEIADFRSLSDLSKRLLQDWTEQDEDGIKTHNANYATVSQKIVELEGRTDSVSLDEPFHALTQNPSYRKARFAFAATIKELNERLA